MLRPNRVNTSQLVALDQAPLDMGTLGGNSLEDEFEPRLADATVRTMTASRMMIATTPAGMADNATVSLGVAINGLNPSGALAAADSPGFLLQCVGHVVVNPIGTGAAQVGFGIGRSDAASLTAHGSGDNPCANFMYLADRAAQYVGAAGTNTASICETVAIGNWDGAIVASSNPLIFAAQVWNRTNGTAQFKIWASLSIWKYELDLDVFDPTRA